LLHRLALGTHDLFVGEVLASWVRDDCLGEDGDLDTSRISPLAYVPLKGGGMYYTLGAPAGKPFDIGKALMGKK
jgi:flavin reductase (DIM6/NTAB) family NADH-FMN oxidoreductase RutF